MSEPAVSMRPYQQSDLSGLYNVCLLTSASGQDGSHLYRNEPRSVGDYYAAPYVAHSPDLCLVLEDAEGVCGYVLGVADTAAYEDWLEQHWFPLMQDRYDLPSGDPAGFTAAERLIGRFHQPVPRESRILLESYPAHLHIDLLPRAQGQGFGRQLMDRFLDLLQARGVPGVHLGLGLRNHRALRFYERLGFVELEKRGDPPNSLLMGLRLTE